MITEDKGSKLRMRTTKLRSIIASLAQTALAMPALLVAGMLTGANTYGGTTTLNGGTLSLANYYSENELAIAGDSAINAALNFPSIWDGPLTGSSTLTLTGYYGGQLSFVYNGSWIRARCAFPSARLPPQPEASPPRA